MKLSASHEYLEGIANHPSIFPAVSVKGQERIDLAGAWDSCFGLEFEGGGWLFQKVDATLFECHTLFLDPKDVRAKAKEALHYIFTATDCLELATKVPRDIPAALGLAKAVGFQHRYTREKAWPRDEIEVDVDYLSVRIEDWILGNKTLIAAGEAFHDALHAEGLHSEHPEDSVHDAYAGLVVECGKSGQMEKGVWLYNRWAAIAGYAQVTTDGSRVYFDDVVASIANGLVKLEKASCQ